MGGREGHGFKGFISFLQTGALRIGRSPVCLASESILTPHWGLGGQRATGVLRKARNWGRNDKAFLGLTQIVFMVFRVIYFSVNH